MRRGEIWTVAGGGDYTGKPRPVVIVQDDAFAELNSLTVCPLTSAPLDLPLLRVIAHPSADNGLATPSRMMVDKVTTVAKRRLGRKIGALSAKDLRALDRALLVFFGLAR